MRGAGEAQPTVAGELPDVPNRPHPKCASVLTAILIVIVLVTLYWTTSRCLCHSESCANPVTKLARILDSTYSPSSSPRLTRYCPRRVLLATALAAGILIDIVLLTNEEQRKP
jgi:hypothetical protein